MFIFFVFFQVKEVFDNFQQEFEKKSEATDEKLDRIDATVNDFKAANEGHISDVVKDSQELKVGTKLEIVTGSSRKLFDGCSCFRDVKPFSLRV